MSARVTTVDGADAPPSAGLARSPRILFASSEVAPYSKSGGLGDVAQALPRALADLGAEVTVVTPDYGGLSAEAGARPVERRAISFPLETYELALSEVRPAEGLRIVFAASDRLFERPAYYGEDGEDYADNPLRFAALSRIAALMALDDQMDILHANDWQTAEAVDLVASLRGPGGPATLFSIHNLAFQGTCHRGWAARLGWSRERLDGGALEFHGKANPLKSALLSADAVGTVSPTYAREITTPAYGCGLDGVLAHDVRRLVGITNGVDPSWDPATDDHLPARYDVEDLRGKARCRDALVEAFELDAPRAGGERVPIAGIVSRMTDQKGIDVALDAAEPLLARDALRLIILGTGDRALEEQVREMASRHPGRMAARIAYDETLAHRIVAGSDLYLMPSRFEPCGLNQQYAMRYGTPPIVHAVGGLADTVIDADASPQGTGFAIDDLTVESLRAAIDRALRSHRDRPRWHQIVQNGMTRDCSWEPPSRRYLALYRTLTGERREQR